MNPDSPGEIRALLSARGLTLKKRWGQNFLINRGARERLVSLLDVNGGETTWEIGPGLGSMTGLLLEKSARLLAFELDRGICRYLTENLGDLPAFTLIPGDFLETWKQAVADHGRPDRVLGNLPYRSASLMIADLVEGGLRPGIMIFTVQRELADRMCSRPGTKSYSSFSVLCQSCFEVSGRGDLKPGSFYPVPEVVSTIVEMRPRPGAPEGPVLALLSELARGLFAARRKTIRNNVSSARVLSLASPEAVLAALQKAGVDPGRRAEELPPETFVQLARELRGS